MGWCGNSGYGTVIPVDNGKNGVINAYWEDVTVTLPELARPGAWYLCVNTFGDGNGRYFYEKGQEPRIEHDFCMRPRSVAIFTGRNY